MRKKVFKTVLSAVLLFLLCTANAYAQSVSDLMYYAFEPVGKCLYVYGGGWNEADTAAGYEAMQKGVSESWSAFYNLNSADYDYKKTRYLIHDGLDCTGYVGWCMYQLFENTYSQNGYVYLAEEMAEKYSGIFKGNFTSKSNIVSRECGDVMSSSGHAYIVVGECNDKSLVLLHSSPPAVSLCGTCTPGGNTDSEAVRLATFYMNTFFKECHTRYPNCSKGISYLTDYDRMSWNYDILTDTDGYRKMYAGDILNDIFYNTKVYINGERAAKDKPVYNVNSAVYVPLRAVSEKLGAAVDWNNGEIDVKRDGINVVFHVDSDRAIVNGESMALRYKVFLVDNTAYMPLRFISEIFGNSVSWDSYKNAAYVY